MQSPGNTKISRIATLGMLLAVSLVLAYIESIITLSFSIPGIKLGLPNLCVVLLLYRYGVKEAITVNALRIMIAGFMFGNISMIIYSCAGAMFSMICMLLIYRLKFFSSCGVSIIGGVTHNIGQCIMASIMVSSFNIFVYVPVLIIAGAITGFVIGIVSEILIPRFRSISN